MPKIEKDAKLDAIQRDLWQLLRDEARAADRELADDTV